MMTNQQPEKQVIPVAPLDPYTQRVTSGLAYVGGVLLLPMLFALLSGMRWNGLLVPTTLAVAIGLFLLLAYAGQPVCYHLTPSHLTIQRRWLRPITIALSDITGVSLAHKLSRVPAIGVRLAFNPGVFGYQGIYFLIPTGRVFFLATNRERLIAVVRLSAMPIILSPAFPQSCIERIEAARTAARSRVKT